MKKQIATAALAFIAIGGGVYGVSSVIKENAANKDIIKTEPIVTALPSEDIISVPTTTATETTIPTETVPTGTRVGIEDTASFYDEYTNEAMGYYISINSYKVDPITKGVSFECSASIKNINDSAKNLTISAIRLIDEETKMQYACTSAYMGSVSLPNKSEFVLNAGKTEALAFKGAVGITGEDSPKCALYLTIKDSVTGDILNLYLKLYSSIYDADVKEVNMTEESLPLEEYGIVVSHKESKTIQMDNDSLLVAELFTIENLTDSPVTLYGYMASLTTNKDTILLPTTQDSKIVFPNDIRKIEEVEVVLNGINTSSTTQTEDNSAEFTFSSMIASSSEDSKTNYTIKFSIYLYEYTQIVEFTYQLTE